MAGKHPRRRRRRRRNKPVETQTAVVTSPPAPLNLTPSVPLSTIRERFKILKGVSSHG